MARERRTLLQPTRSRASARDPAGSHRTANKLLFPMCHSTFPWRALMYSEVLDWGVGLFKTKKKNTKQRLWFETRSSAHLWLPRCWCSNSTENYMLCCEAKIKRGARGYCFSLAQKRRFAIREKLCVILNQPGSALNKDSTNCYSAETGQY